MVEEVPLTQWEIEDIPDRNPQGEDYLLFRHIFEKFIKDDAPEIITPSAFKDEYNKGLSTDWSKYSTAKETQLRKKKHPPEKYAVVSLIVREIRTNEVLKELSIDHSPIQTTTLSIGNRAHTNINGILKYGRSHKKNKAQVFLARLAEWKINKKLNLDSDS